MHSRDTTVLIDLLCHVLLYYCPYYSSSNFFCVLVKINMEQFNSNAHMLTARTRELLLLVSFLFSGSREKSKKEGVDATK